MSRLKKGGAVAVVAVGLIGSFEGLRLNAYPDPATRGHPWTVCYGETSGVKRGDKHSLAECKAMLVQSLEKYAVAVEKCIVRPLPDGRFVAYVSLAYNIGTGGFCKSSVARLYNEGRTQASCDYMLKYNRAAGMEFPGLTRRRTAERELCLRGEL